MKKLIVGALLIGTLGIAACATPEQEPTNSAKAAKAQAEQPTETVGQKNARNSAQSYLDTTAFSRAGLIKQLKFEGFSKADAAYAIGSIDPNWNKQAAKSAKSYMDTGSFSASGLQTQLEFEGYTAAQAAAGVAAAGY